MVLHHTLEHNSNLGCSEIWGKYLHVLLAQVLIAYAKPGPVQNPVQDMCQTSQALLLMILSGHVVRGLS